MLKIFRKLSLLTSLMLIVALVLSACGTDTSGSATPTTGTSAGTTPTAAATSSTGGTTDTTPTTGAAGGDTTPTTGAGGAGTTPTTGAGGAGTTPTTSASGGGTTPTLKNPDTIVEATIGGPETLDPAWAYDTSSSEVIFNIYETLVFMNKDQTSQFVPMLASKWTISDDGKTYTFDIRKGVKFHAGQDLTPEDVAYSIQRGLIQDRSGGPQWIMLQPFFGLDVQTFADDVVGKQNGGDYVKGCQAVQQAITFDNNAGTVTMHLKQPYGPMLQILTGSWASIVSKSWVASQGGWDGDCATAEKFHDPKAEADELFKVTNGTGPYKLDRWATGEEIDLARNDNYWLKEPMWQGGPSGPAKASRAVIKYITEWGTRFSTFQAGDADMAYVDRQYISQVDPLVKETCDISSNCSQTNANGSFRVYKGLPTSAMDVIGFNQAVNTTGGNQRIGSGALDGQGVPADFFADEHVRKGFNYAFDWDTYIKEIYLGEAVQSLGPVPQGMLGYDQSQAHYTFDLNKAADEFKASTMKSPSGASLWDTGFTVQFVYNSGNDQRKTLGEILKDGLSKVNPKFIVNVTDEPFAALLQDSNDGRLPLSIMGWQEDFHDPHDWVSPYLASAGAYSGQQHFAKDLQTQLDGLIQQAVASNDQATRTKLYAQMQDLTYQNALDIFVVQPQTRHYEQTWIKGYYYNPIYPGEYFYAFTKGE
jgi:peptide/nickel transport system substrate-binding protein